jgi:hypothetical protein
MERREFLELLATTPLASVRLDAAEDWPAPRYRVVTRYAPAAVPGMPGPFPARVVRTRSARLPEKASVAVDPLLVREMMERGMRSLTGRRRRSAPGGASSSRRTSWRSRSTQAASPTASRRR